MATLQFLPATTYQPPSPTQVRGRERLLNTIMEEEESVKGSGPAQTRSRNRSFREAEWTSPMSDHFPTPRGTNFMSITIPPSSPSSTSSSSSPSCASAPWTRSSFASTATEFEDLYDVSDDEISRRKSTHSLRRTFSRRKRSNATASRRFSGGSLASGEVLPSLVIPTSKDEILSPIPQVKKILSPVPPTPPPKVPISPALLSYYLTAHEEPMNSGPPSLDGSMSSEQMAALSAPPTPDIGNDETNVVDNWGGLVQLQPAALATLQALAGEDMYEEEQSEQVIEVPPMPASLEMQQSPPPQVSSIRRHESVVLSPTQQRAFESLTRLDIPSPGGFFAGLTPATRHTWHMPSPAPPSSTTAEHFYKTPWSNAPVERIIEVPESMSDGEPTARPFITQESGSMARPDTRQTDYTGPTMVESPVEEIVAEINPGASYTQKLKEIGSSNVDRTSLWLTAQTKYLDSLINPKEARDDDETLKRRHTIIHGRTKSSSSDSEPIPELPQTDASPAKKGVRFSEIITIKQDEADPLPLVKFQESTYYRAFQAQNHRARCRDTFVHSIPRFEALQSQRVTFSEAHRSQLLGKYQLSVKPLSAKKRMSANVARGDELTFDDPEKIQKDKQHEATMQMSKATWNVQATRALNNGRLIAAPVAKRLARLSRMGPSADGTPRDRARILDLGGQATCDWAWHCAAEYPNTKVYTVTTKTIRQATNANIKGPKNHRQVAVEHLTRLPFRDDQFDLISARHLHSILKEGEYDACLAECMRILKPGGYLEFNIIDSEIVNAGPHGLAKSVEFGFSLKTRGYDPLPTQQWLARLHRAGFVNTKRAWLFLPMGAPNAPAPAARDSLGVEVKLELEAMIQGSTSAAAPIAGLVGSWAWEKWMLKLQLESGKDEDKLLEGVAEIVEEGRKLGSGWRTLNGWTRKPLN